jgi:hypothetical protein
MKLDTTEITVEAGKDYTVKTTQSEISADLTKNDYSAMYGKTVTFDIANGNPASSQYIALEGANAANLETDTKGVFINVDASSKDGYTEKSNVKKNNGKFYSLGRKNAQVRHEVTYITVPVVKGSEIAITTASGDGFAVLDTTDIVSSYTYEGEDESTVTFYVPSDSSDSYLSSITITSPAKTTAPTVTLTGVESQQFKQEDGYDQDVTAAALTVDVAGSISGVSVKYNGETKTGTTETTITTGTIIVGAIVPGLVTDLSTSSFTVTAVE